MDSGKLNLSSAAEHWCHIALQYHMSASKSNGTYWKIEIETITQSSLACNMLLVSLYTEG